MERALTFLDVFSLLDASPNGVGILEVSLTREGFMESRPEIVIPQRVGSTEEQQLCIVTEMQLSYVERYYSADALPSQCGAEQSTNCLAYLCTTG